MSKAEMMALLAKQYGIQSEKELEKAIGGMTKINIGVCAAPVRKEKVHDGK